MDGISAAASILTIVTVALQSASYVNAIVTGIKDGPKQARELASAIGDLDRVLQQLSRLKILREEENGCNLSEFKRLILKCADDVKGFGRTLINSQHLLGDKKLSKAWKQVRSSLKQSDFQQMSRIVNHHFTTLELQLSLLQR